MIYIDNNFLPDNFKNDNGFNLCKLWFVTLYGTPLSKSLIKKFDDSSIKLEEISPYKLCGEECGEIIAIDGRYYVGDGYGNITYSPFRDKPTQILKIDKKYKVMQNYG